MGNVKIRCRLEKIDKTGNYTQLKKAIFHWSIQGLMNVTKLFFLRYFINSQRQWVLKRPIEFNLLIKVVKQLK